jgi:tRNA(Ile)-lysidine synthase
MGARLSFEKTERLLDLAYSGARGSQIELTSGLVAERGFRELRFTRIGKGRKPAAAEYCFSLPGEVRAAEFGIVLRGGLRGELDREGPGGAKPAVLRNWKAGDRVTLRYSSGPKRVKEVLDRLQARGMEREIWPVVEIDGKIVWMQGVEVSAPDFIFTASPLNEAGDS